MAPEIISKEHMTYFPKLLLSVAFDLIAALVLPFVCLAARMTTGKIDIGIGPWPSIAAAYQKDALERAGYSAETYVFWGDGTTSSFDYFANHHVRWPFGRLLPYFTFVRAIFRYKALYISFVGGALGDRPICGFLEPLFYKIAGRKTAVFPYGSDVQEFTRSPNLLFKHFMGQYDRANRLNRHSVARRIDRWTRWGDHLVGGVEWVDYMYHWDTLMLMHFSIDTFAWPMMESTPWTRGEREDFVLLHATNHPLLKGTQFFESAVRELRAAGLPVQLQILSGVSNDVIKIAMLDADAIADQLVVGWYAMFAIEGMALGKPVFCYLRPDLLDLYVQAGIVDRGDMPIINCTAETFKDSVRKYIEDRERQKSVPLRSRAYVEKYHSSAAMSSAFVRINESLGIRRHVLSHSI